MATDASDNKKGQVGPSAEESWNNVKQCPIGDYCMAEHCNLKENSGVVVKLTSLAFLGIPGQTHRLCKECWIQELALHTQQHVVPKAVADSATRRDR